MLRNDLALWMIVACVCCSGCGELSLPVPPQRIPLPYELRQILTVGAPVNLNALIIRGVEPVQPHLDWSWTGEHPAFRFQLDSGVTWNLKAKITVADIVLKQVGPQHVRFLVNGTTVGAATLDQPHTFNLAFPVDRQLLNGNGQADVELGIGPCLPQPGGKVYCTLLHEIGFTGSLTPTGNLSRDTPR
jgi:hypothetical protein